MKDAEKEGNVVCSCCKVLVHIFLAAKFSYIFFFLVGRQRGVFLMMIEEDLLAAVQGTIAKEEEEDCYVLLDQDSGRPRRGIRQAGTCVPSRAAKRRVNPRISRGVMLAAVEDEMQGCSGSGCSSVIDQAS